MGGVIETGGTCEILATNKWRKLAEEIGGGTTK
jgi:hypothetical protein